jgi:uncharacterized SAM-binding protein YcdF (DUF218 family)
MPWNDPAIEPSLATAWNYMRLVHPVAAADAILALGSFDPMVAVCAAALWHAKVAAIIIMSGGIAHRDSLLATGWDSSEAQVFADVAVKEGVPRQAIILEDKAQNTGENFSRSKALSEKLGLKIGSLIVVAKPYMTRRGFATGRQVWPGAVLCLQCEDIGVLEYFKREPDPERTLHALVGDLHRIIVYPKLGYQVRQRVPRPVRAALGSLVAAGYGSRLVAAPGRHRLGCPGNSELFRDAGIKGTPRTEGRREGAQ